VNLLDELQLSVLIDPQWGFLALSLVVLALIDLRNAPASDWLAYVRERQLIAPARAEILKQDLLRVREVVGFHI